MDWLAISGFALSIFALLFTLYSFWWMNWRRGKLRVGAPRSFAFHNGLEKFVVRFPLVFFNAGAVPIVVENLRLVFREHPNRPLRFIATLKSIQLTSERTMATQFPVRSREAILLVCEFQRESEGGSFAIVLEERNYDVELQARLDTGERRSSEWARLINFQLRLDASIIEAGMSKMLIFDNMAVD
jgi:hypothetical protein